MTRSYRSSDKQLAPNLAAAVATVRGSMTAAAERRRMPARFDAIEHPDTSSMIVTDLETGRSSIVPLFAYGAVREALNDLFGEG